ncbi:MAG: FkbM family methyltransferase [Ardenticatenaceae bacterium]|nr:FkbM family methyltransferase [Ardenticatenaceae bacterium]
MSKQKEKKPHLTRETRNEIYEEAPVLIKWIWDILGGNKPHKRYPKPTQTASRLDVLFAIRFICLHEPSEQVLQKLYRHVTSFNFNSMMIVHHLQYSDQHLQKLEKNLQHAIVPKNPIIIGKAYKLFLKRTATLIEYCIEFIRIIFLPPTYSDFVTRFLKSKEYELLQEKENQPHLVQTKKFRIFIRPNDYFAGAHLAEHGVYEIKVTSYIEKLIKEGDFVIDIGANIGYHTMNFARLVQSRGRVFAFEPNPHNLELIELSKAENGFTNIKLFPYAVGNEETVLDLVIEGWQSNAHLFNQTDLNSRSITRIPVKVTKIDKALQGVEKLDFVKMDAEGAELMILNGMKETLKRHRPVIIFEFFPDYIEKTSQGNPTHLLDGLISLGYELRMLLDQGLSQSAHTTNEIMHYLEPEEAVFVDILAVPSEDLHKIKPLFALQKT